MVENVLAQVAYKIKAGELLLQHVLPHEVVYLNCDEEKITWAILQLLENAIKFTPKGGRIMLAAQRDESHVVIAVTDTGIGIPPERLKEIFEPFHQLDSAPTRRYSGTGLGLALLKRILDAHNTQIKVFSEPEKGTRFWFSLPVAGNVN